MTGIEELRHLAQHIRTKSATGYVTVVASHHAIELEIIADQIERERACDADTIENVRLIVGEVVTDMERHVSGHEGADDSPVARWARELRRALKSDTSDAAEQQKPSCHDPADAAGVTSGAAKVTRDPAEDVSVSAYDLLPADEREAIAWVRDHGGLDSVKKLLDWVVGHCSTRQQLDFDFWLSGRVMHELGFEEDMADRDEVERRLLARLMPDGMEWLVEAWPKWSNGEYCKFGDWWTADKYGDYEPKQLRRLVFYTPEQLREWEQDEGDNFGYEWDFMRPSDTTYRPDKAEPPAPKVLDADGAEIYKGRIAYGTRGRKYRVTELCEYEPSIVHAQAIDDGELGDEFIAANTGLNSYQLDASKLTHERPDSWERLEADAEKDPCGYFGFDGEEACGKCPASGKNCEQTMALDIVRRAKKLAGGA